MLPVASVRMVGKPYLGITSCLPVICPQSPAAANRGRNSLQPTSCQAGLLRSCCLSSPPRHRGPGPNLFGNVIAPAQLPIDAEHDVLSALAQWVEKGVAPDNIIATHLHKDVIDRTRRLCPYPKAARWDGSGSSDDAKSFRCVEEALEGRAARQR
jgi:hypothetical protein